MAKILVVSDEPGVQEAVRLRLEQDAHSVVAAGGGGSGGGGGTAADVLESARAQDSDLVIVDSIPPHVPADRLDVVRRLRSDPETMQIPFLLIAEKADALPILREGNLESDDLLEAPFHVDDLALRVTRKLIFDGRDRPKAAAPEPGPDRDRGARQDRSQEHPRASRSDAHRHSKRSKKIEARLEVVRVIGLLILAVALIYLVRINERAPDQVNIKIYGFLLGAVALIVGPLPEVVKAIRRRQARSRRRSELRTRDWSRKD